MDTPHSPWRPPLLWRAALLLARCVVALLARLRVTGDVPESWRRGPLILAANHINPFDPIVLAAACRARGVAPRFMATGGLFRAPLLGAAMRHAGHIRVDRGTAAVSRALVAAAEAASDSAVLVYPEGRIGLDPHLWPERGKTGTARLALASGAPVVPVAQWGSHEVLPYRTTAGAVLRGITRALWRRPVIRVHFGPAVALADLPADSPGAARRATDRIIDAITDALVPLRRDEPEGPRHVDPSRPVDTSRTHRYRPRAR
ncbi:lysophospholipid acyltransferase family protein [Micromonospora yangpuensis]|uniref:1-acyl-sn-glycerol-3-phosphate acyltransferases n=1 Tax=Micromonospora yangpuensis TaxID=683228 RepID=A0A1C6UQF1_9ACTN|nr:lysophospholipid acyltransferase family protein [Micromonospora yangpuensis]GGM07726.1 1-acyl-sn-glycerol-3-phosphate acyltransferase [Micromonospora yangpuensis]SCL56238.1 1-acyl-sn-glycerol-3-phosphate acyltransferases [Micromonospora yangpuensis]